MKVHRVDPFLRFPADEKDRDLDLRKGLDEIRIRRVRHMGNAQAREVLRLYQNRELIQTA